MNPVPAHLAGVGDGLAGAGHFQAVATHRCSGQPQGRREHLRVSTEGQNSAHQGGHVYNSLFSQNALQKNIY